MGHSSTTITAPVSLHADVYPVLGLTKTGTYYDTGWVCGNSHGRINMWARNKPVRVNQVGEITDSQRHSVSFGLSATFSPTQDPVWTYLSPRPGTDWCRLTDFNGYNHASECGLSWKNYNYAKDLFNDKTALTVALQDSTSLITAYDLRDTIFNGMRLRLLMTNHEGSGQAYAADINIDRQSLTFTIPYNQLLLRGAGEYNLSVYGLTSGNEIRRIFPPVYERGLLTVTNNTGINVEAWKDGAITFRIYDEDSNFYLWSEYQVGHGDNVLNLTNQLMFIIEALSVESNGSLTVGWTNMFIQFEWDVSTGRAIKRTPLLNLNNLGESGEWVVGPGHSLGASYGCLRANFPKLTNSGQANQYTTLCITYKHTDGNYYTVTPKIDLRIKCDSGTDPDFINPN